MNLYAASPSPEAGQMYNDQDIFTQDMAFSAQLADQNGWSYFKNSTTPSNQHSLYSSRYNSQSRVRKAPPVPVPNLTKKSRGRRVPTIADPDSDGSGSGGVTKTRTFKCSVASCGKCFLRGEHLKRHVRSIHTHDKPFKCTIPSCGKHFSRRDNLFQHLKIHKDQSSAFTTQNPLSTTYSDRDDNSDYQRSSTSPVITAIRPSFTIPTTPSPLLYSQQPLHYSLDYSVCNRFATDTVFNVSSLRTEPLSSISLDYHYAMSNDAPSEYPLMQHSPSYSDSMMISTSHSIGEPQYGHSQAVQYFSN